MPIDLFSKTALPDMVPEEMQIIINELRKSSSQDECLRRAYDIMVAKYCGNRLKTFTQFMDIFESDIAVLWKRQGFLHCTNANYVMRALLVKSGIFSESDIRLVWTHIWYLAPHQYLQVRVGDRWQNIDVWAHVYGIGFGRKASGLHQFRVKNN